MLLLVHGATHGQTVLMSRRGSVLQVSDFGMASRVAIAQVRKCGRVCALTVSLLRLRRFDTVSAFDYICLQADWSRAAVQLQEQSACIAQDGAGFISSPERCRRGLAVGAYGRLLTCQLLLLYLVISSSRLWRRCRRWWWWW